MQSKAFYAFALSAFTMTLAFGVEAHERTICRNFDGPFASDTVPPPTCTSPVGLCTHGLLQGDFPADYDFTFSTLQSSGDPTDPTAFVYTGHSTITTKHFGIIHTDDSGVIHIPATGPSHFTTTAVAATGTGRFVGVTGAFVATGDLDFTTGHADGSYFAHLCSERGDCFH